jgi:hypothetical protein
MRATRNTFVEAKSQQRPDERWFVMGAPSRGILMLKVWVSATAAAWFVRMDWRGFAERAATARRFFGLASSFSCQSFAWEMESWVLDLWT